MCGHCRCDCGEDCGCCCHQQRGGYGEKARCGCGGECACEHEAGGCRCGGETESCNCGHGGGEQHDGHGHHGHHARGFQRRFISRAERIAELEAYLSELRAEAEAGAAYLKDIQAEADAVKERIAALKAA